MSQSAIQSVTESVSQLVSQRVPQRVSQSVCPSVNHSVNESIKAHFSCTISFIQIFSSIYGCGPATARKWYEKGYRSMADIIQAVSAGMKLTEQQSMGKGQFPNVWRFQVLFLSFTAFFMESWALQFHTKDSMFCLAWAWDNRIWNNDLRDPNPVLWLQSYRETERQSFSLSLEWCTCTVLIIMVFRLHVHCTSSWSASFVLGTPQYSVSSHSVH